MPPVVEKPDSSTTTSGASIAVGFPALPSLLAVAAIAACRLPCGDGGAEPPGFWARRARHSSASSKFWMRLSSASFCCCILRCLRAWIGLRGTARPPEGRGLDLFRGVSCCLGDASTGGPELDVLVPLPPVWCAAHGTSRDGTATFRGGGLLLTPASSLVLRTALGGTGLSGAAAAFCGATGAVGADTK